MRRIITKSLLAALCAATCINASATIEGISGEGTASSPYLISTADDWNTVAAYANSLSDSPLAGEYLQITALLDFSSTTATPITNFCGELDGGGYIIRGVSFTADDSYQGALFTSVGADGYIHDFTFSGSAATGSTSTKYCGAVVGQLDGTIENVISSADVYSSAYYGSGMVGYAGSTASIKDCAYYGTHTMSAYYCGCIVGYADSGCTISGCSNQGAVYAYSVRLGCIVGYANGVNISECSNSASITFTQMQTYLGGIAGVSKKSVITDCVNYSDMSNACGYLAGIVADADSNTILGCSNYGNISYSSTITVYGYSAGIVAYGYGDVISNCINSGTITGGGIETAGIAAYDMASTITNCYNTGDITGGTRTAGIMANASGLCTISECYNAGTVTSTGSYIGAIAAYSTGATVERCFNVAPITSSGSYVGGIAGQVKTITDCYNTGDIEGSDYTAGIAGNGLSNVTNCYSLGATTCSGSNIANINNRTAASNSNNYYLSINDAATIDDSSTGLTYAQMATLDLGDNWEAGDDYTYPRIAAIANNDFAIAHAAAVIPADGDSYDSITGAFSVGQPSGVAWSASPDVISIESNTASFTASLTGTLIMTATSGDVEVDTELYCDVEVEGISSTIVDGRTIVSQKCYSTSGCEIPADQASKTATIIVNTYDDGTTEAIKVIK